MTVLVTNADDWIALAVCRSLGKRGIDAAMASHRKDAMSFSSKYCKERHIYRDPSCDPEGFMDDLAEIAESGSYEYVVPTNDITLMAISSMRDRLEKYVTVPLPSHETIELCDDKSKTLRLAEKEGIPCPRTAYIKDEADLKEVKKTFSFPVVIKPFRGQGARGVKFVTSPEDLQKEYETTHAQHGEAMVQEYVRGTRYLLAALYNKNFEARTMSLHRVIRFVGGATIYGETDYHPEAVEYGLRLLKRAGVYGMGQVDFIVDEKDGTPKLMEINPRFFGSVQIHIAAGVDYPYLFHRLVTEGDIEKRFEYRRGVRSRYILKDMSHLVVALSGRSPYNYKMGKASTLFEFIRSFSCRDDYVFSGSDPGPGISELKNLFLRKVRG